MRSYLDFEKPVAELEAKVAELRALESADSAAAIGEEISRLETKAAQTLKELYAELTPWQKTQVARHPERPHCLDYIGSLITDFISLAGDRRFGEDVAIVGGFGRFRGDSVCVIGHEKGSSTESRLKHNFGRLWRSYRDRIRQPGPDARACDLHRDLAGRCCFDPMARHIESAGGGDQLKDHRR